MTDFSRFEGGQPSNKGFIFSSPAVNHNGRATRPSLAIQSLSLHAIRLLVGLERSVCELMHALQSNALATSEAMLGGHTSFPIMPLDVESQGNSLWGTAVLMGWMGMRLEHDAPKFAMTRVSHAGGAQSWSAEVDGVAVASRHLHSPEFGEDEHNATWGTWGPWVIEPSVLTQAMSSDSTAALDLLVKHLVFAQNAHIKAKSTFEKCVHAQELRARIDPFHVASYCPDPDESQCAQARELLKTFGLKKYEPKGIKKPK